MQVSIRSTRKTQGTALSRPWLRTTIALLGLGRLGRMTSQQPSLFISNLSPLYYSNHAEASPSSCPVPDSSGRVSELDILTTDMKPLGLQLGWASLVLAVEVAAAARSLRCIMYLTGYGVRDRTGTSVHWL